MLYIPTIAFFSFFFSDMKLSQYISSQPYFLKIHLLLGNTHYWKIIFIFPFAVPLKCSTDIQSSNGKSLLYMYYEYVSSYVTKMRDDNLLQALIFKTFYTYLKLMHQVTCSSEYCEKIIYYTVDETIFWKQSILFNFTKSWKNFTKIWKEKN